MPKNKPQLDHEYLRARLKLKELSARQQLEKKHPHIKTLLTGGVLAGSILLASPQADTLQAALPESAQEKSLSPLESRKTLVEKLKEILPQSVQRLNEDQERQVSALLHEYFGLHAYADLEGERLNRNYGYIGLEQNLRLYPGDNRPNTAPGLGAWGYFAPSKAALTPDLIEKERYYVAVQTLYLPDWSTRLSYLRDWYKYRKVALINPKNGKVIIAVIADSGPAAFTGKSFGGSPEVMKYLEMKDGKQKGPVVLFFVDDPSDEVPLGPLEYNLERPLKLT